VNHGPRCAQAGLLSPAYDTTTVEDCLTVNVWTPDKAAPSPAPVLVWIHGGAFVFGSNSDADYDGQALSEATGAVVVTVNYRLGPFGALAHPALKAEDPSHPSSGAYGLEDQRAALAWVKANIAAFGGDPGKVTLFGESAGGISTCMHMASPKSEGLFQRAIIESGPCNSAVAEADAFAQGEELVMALGCGDADASAASVLECLRGKSTEAIMSALPASGDLIFGEGPSWFPVLDGWNLPDQPEALLAAGSAANIPTILGSNADEGTLFFALAETKVADDAAFEALAEKLVPGKGKEVVALYPTATFGSAEKAAMAAVGDAGFVCPARRAARALEKAGGSAYLYHFTYVPMGTLLPNLGAYHSSEIKSVFGNSTQLASQPLTDEEKELSATIQGYWSRHAETGDPNGDGAAEWPKYNAAKDENIVLNPMISTQSGLRKDLCDFWDGALVVTP
jgi:para-nitrobenzyl esterase